MVLLAGLDERMRKIGRFTYYVFKHFIDNDGLYRASALTFTTLIALVPLMSVSFSILAAFPTFRDISQPIQDFIFTNFVPETGQVVQSYLSQFAQQAARLSMFGTATLLVTAILLMFTIEQAFNAIWQVRIKRSFVGGFVVYWTVLSLAPLMMGLGFFTSTYLFSLPELSDLVTTIGVDKNGLIIWTPFILSVITFTFLYVAVPNCRVPLWHGLIGAIMAALLFEAAKRGFGIYLQRFDTYELLYGAFAVIPIFFFWVYSVWVIILLGAEIAHALSGYYNQPVGKTLRPFNHAVHWLGYLWEAQQVGEERTLEQLIQLDKARYAVSPDEQIAALITANLVKETGNRRFILSRDLSRMTLEELINLLPWKVSIGSGLPKSMHCWDRALADKVQQVVQLGQQPLQTKVAEIFGKGAS